VKLDFYVEISKMLFRILHFLVQAIYVSFGFGISGKFHFRAASFAGDRFALSDIIQRDGSLFAAVAFDFEFNIFDAEHSNLLFFSAAAS
jgi:hypothetical protein